MSLYKCVCPASRTLRLAFALSTPYLTPATVNTKSQVSASSSPFGTGCWMSKSREKTSMKYILFGLMGLAMCGCSKPREISYGELLSSLTNLAQVASLAVPQSYMITSYDRTGENEDYNHFQGKTPDGQFILADLKGPGVVSRFWFTGDPHNPRFHFYFDDEAEPRFSFSWEELDAGHSSMNIPPLAMTEQICWRSFLPIPYRKRLRITVDDAGYAYGRAPKLYYQINWNELPRRQTVESFSLGMLENNGPLIDAICSDWDRKSFSALPTPGEEGLLTSGKSLELYSQSGQGTVRALVIEPDFSKAPSALARISLFRDLVLNIYWDGAEKPSVSVPFGDFFGSMWQRWAGQSMLFGMDQDSFFSRWPMPFREGVRIEIQNQGAVPVPLRWAVDVDETPVAADAGYFHAAFNRSGANATGSPHIVLKTLGDGKFVGCLLGVWSLDNSFWVLEADEMIWIDGGKGPFWHGTGLEDYFNSGWYYRKVFDRPLHGLPVKSPFRTVQYRLHLDDAVLFSKSFDMVFERGPNHASKALFDSVAFYYLKEPQPTVGGVGTPSWRTRPSTQLEQVTLMTDLWNLERFNDLSGQIEWIDQYLERSNPPFAEVLALRKLMCRYELAAVSKDELLRNLAVFSNSSNPEVRSFAGILESYCTDPSVFLLGAYCSTTSEVYLDGQLMLTAGNPEQPVVLPVKLENGPHVIAVKSVWGPYPTWMQAWVQSPEGLLTEGSDWKQAVNPSGNWNSLAYDDSKWPLAGYSLEGVKSPPEIPHVWVAPDPYVNASSKALPVCPAERSWNSRKGFIVYRKVFEVK
jgi:hypothetical protein